MTMSHSIKLSGKRLDYMVCSTKQKELMIQIISLPALYDNLFEPVTKKKMVVKI